MIFVSIFKKSLKKVKCIKTNIIFNILETEMILFKNRVIFMMLKTGGILFVI
jgi:hypothetical protein